MADHRYAATLWAGADDLVRKAAQSSFRYILRNLKIGPAEDQKIAGNFGGIWYKVVTSTTANQEFSVAHQQNQIPTMLMTGMPLNDQGAKIVNVEVSQPADQTRIYLKSPSTNSTCYLYVEFGGL